MLAIVLFLIAFCLVTSDFYENHLEELREVLEIEISEILECLRVKQIYRLIPRQNIPKITTQPGYGAVVIYDIIDSVDAYNLGMLRNCVRNLLPDHLEDRHFDMKGYGGGNNVTFINGLLQHTMPSLFDHIISNIAFITERVGWRPHPYHLGIRCVEILDYVQGSELLWHKDTHSIYTISILLTHPDEMHGGQFLIRPLHKNTEKLPILNTTLTQYGGVLFDSESDHAVETITQGRRRVLVFELWPNVDNPDSFRPSPQDVTVAKKPYLLTVPPLAVPYKKDLFSTALDSREILILLLGLIGGLLIGLLVLFLDSSSPQNPLPSSASQEKKVQ